MRRTCGTGISRRCTSGRLRRPMAACRVALLATLLPDPGTDEGRRALRRRIGGLIEEKTGADGRMKEETVGGILHWGREDGPELAAFREEIREAFGGRAPWVLDPFAGGGAIPLEAMRLGCEVTASDINPVAWFILTERAALSAVDGDGETAAPGVRGRGPGVPGRAREGARGAEASGYRCFGRRGASRRSSPGICGHGGSGCWIRCARSWRRGIRPMRSSSRCGGRGGGIGRGSSGPLRPDYAAGARAGRRGAGVGRRLERRVRFLLSERRGDPALGGEADGGVPLGADLRVREIPGRAPAAEELGGCARRPGNGSGSRWSCARTGAGWSSESSGTFPRARAVRRRGASTTGNSVRGR